MPQPLVSSYGASVMIGQVASVVGLVCGVCFVYTCFGRGGGGGCGFSYTEVP